VRAVYRAGDLPPAERIGEPGEYPFTRGNFAGGYRDRVWTLRQYSGFGTATESNARYRYLLEQGATGLSVALDLPTQCGYDSDDPDAEGEVGRVGVAVDTLRDVELLFDGIPLDRISTSFTINGTAAILLAFYVAAAEKAGVLRAALRGTIQNDILKEYAARGTWIWPVRPSIRLIADTIEFCAAEVPRFNAISVAGAHFRDAGASAVQEMAFTLADGIAYCDEVVGRGRMTIDDFAPQISFFFYTHRDFFEEVAKYRAGRRRWATIVRERYGAKDDRSCMFRFGCVCGGASLYAPQAQNNIVEALTDAMVEQIVEVMDDVEVRGGMARAVEEGYIQRLIGEEAYRLQRAVEAGESVIVGVNRFTTDEPVPETEMYELDEAGLRAQLERLAEVKRERDDSRVRAALAELARGAHSDGVNLMGPLVDCAHAYCTVGEMVGVLKDAWGEFRQPRVF
jgi:methylmalonyl-CoA mutase N-terminal domain/subunit